MMRKKVFIKTVVVLNFLFVLPMFGSDTLKLFKYNSFVCGCKAKKTKDTLYFYTHLTQEGYTTVSLSFRNKKRATAFIGSSDSIFIYDITTGKKQLLFNFPSKTSIKNTPNFILNINNFFGSSVTYNKRKKKLFEFEFDTFSTHSSFFPKVIFSEKKEIVSFEYYDGSQNFICTPVITDSQN